MLVVDPIAGICSMAPFEASAFIGKFVEEARDRLTALGEASLSLKQAPDERRSHDAIGEAMRQAHSLKGSAQMLGFSDVWQISHQLEDLFVAGRRNPSLLNGDALDVVLAAVDLLSVRVEQLALGMLEPVEVGELSRKLSKLVMS